MYIPPDFAESRPTVLHELIVAHPLGLLVTHGPAGLDANHLPFELQVAADGAVVLRAHVARANPVWQAPGDGADVLVVFRGAAGYVSPNWYPSKQDHHRQVPTWNYEAVHAHGRLVVHDDPRFLRGLLARLTRRHEATEARPWKMGDAPAAFIDAELRGIVGIEVVVGRLEGKRKLSQNRADHDDRDVAGVVAGLRAKGEHALADAVRAASSPPQAEGG